MLINKICLIVLPALLVFGCSKDATDECPDDLTVLKDYVDPEGNHVILYDNGAAYLVTDDACTFADQIFTPGFLEATYSFTDSGIFYITEEGPFPTLTEMLETFETYDDFVDMFAMSIADTDKIWNHFTCQSPNFPEIEDYNALRDCVLDGTCNFVDNKIEISPDPFNAANTALKFTSVAPTADMITCKASFTSYLPFFQNGDHIWFEARYLVASGMPFSLVDFENALFEGHPGPRVVLRGGALAFENKFGEKTGYEQVSPALMPLGEWFTLKVHLYLSDGMDGQLQLWQNGALIIDASGINLPTYNSIQNALEVGISATDYGAELYVDDIRLSALPF